MSNIKQLLKQYEEVNAELNKQIKENGGKFIQELFQDIFNDNKGLNLVIVRGHTPSFNDGEPCTHSQETLVARNSYGKYLDYQDYGLEDDFEEGCEEGQHVNSSCESLDTVYKSVTAFDEIIERVYDTNFEIKVSLDESGKVIVEHDYYDCGY